MWMMLPPTPTGIVAANSLIRDGPRTLAPNIRSKSSSVASKYKRLNSRGVVHHHTHGSPLATHRFQHAPHIRLAAGVALQNHGLAARRRDIGAHLLGTGAILAVVDDDTRPQPAANNCAVATPIPRDAPVMKTVWPVKSKVALPISLLFVAGGSQPPV